MYSLRRQKRRGMSLIEVIVVVNVTVMLSFGMYLFYKNVFALSRTFNNTMSTQQQIQTALKEFERETRTMAPSEGGAYPIQEATSTSFTFFSDYDKDGIVERVRYFYSTTTQSLQKGVIEPAGTTYSTASEVFATRIQYVDRNATSSPIFTYFGSSYDGVGTTSALASPVNIPSVRHIRVYVVTVPGGFNQKATSTVIFTTQSTPRNLKDNL